MMTAKMLAVVEGRSLSCLTEWRRWDMANVLIAVRVSLVMYRKARRGRGRGSCFRTREGSESSRGAVEVRGTGPGKT